MSLPVDIALRSPSDAVRIQDLKRATAIMIVSPSSRRLKIIVGIAAVGLIATYVHVRPRWNQATFDYARDYYQSVSSYFGSPVYNNTLYTEGNEGMVSRYYNSSSPCASFPNTDGVLLVMKTGATEAFDRVPTHLLTTLSCLPDFLIFSDMVRPLFLSVDASCWQ